MPCPGMASLPGSTISPVWDRSPFGTGMISTICRVYFEACQSNRLHVSVPVQSSCLCHTCNAGSSAHTVQATIFPFPRKYFLNSSFFNCREFSRQTMLSRNSCPSRHNPWRQRPGHPVDDAHTVPVFVKSPYPFPKRPPTTETC